MAVFVHIAFLGSVVVELKFNMLGKSKCHSTLSVVTLNYMILKNANKSMSL